MGSWYDAIKDAIELARKTDNLGLYERLLDAQRRALVLGKVVAERLAQTRRERDPSALAAFRPVAVAPASHLEESILEIHVLEAEP